MKRYLVPGFIRRRWWAWQWRRRTGGKPTQWFAADERDITRDAEGNILEWRDRMGGDPLRSGGGRRKPLTL